MKTIRKLCIFIWISVFFLQACTRVENTVADKAQKTRYSASFLDVFDTVTQVVGYAETEEEFKSYSQMVQERLEYYHRLYDIYNDYEGIANIKTINDKAGMEAVKVDKDIIDLLKFSKEMYVQTDGKVNIAMGSVLRIWHDIRETATNSTTEVSLPAMEELTLANQYVDIEKLIINEEESTVFLADANMRLDVGSTAKGYATEQVARYLKEQGIDNIMLSVGGNVRAVGSKLDDNGNPIPWSVGIQNPDMTSENQSIVVVNIEDKTLVTSGVYERYFTVGGKNYHHIIDPDTLYPGESYLSVSILCEDSGQADALSTAVFNMDLEQGRALIESLENVEAMWILPDMQIVYSSGFEKNLK